MRPSEFIKRPQNLPLVMGICTFIMVSLSKSKEKCRREKDDDTIKTPSKENILKYLSSKTPYIFDDKNEKQRTYLPFQDCEVTQFWYFGRHGTRNPGKKDTVNMEKYLIPIRDKTVSAFDECRGELSKKQVKKLKDWDMAKNVTIEYESNLVKQGIKELKGIGKRYKKRFPKVFPSNDLLKIHVRSTKSQRTEASALAFVQGAFDNQNISPTLFDKPTKSDPVLKFYEICTKWTEEVDENFSAVVELTDFEISSTMNDTISRVSTKLGLGYLGNLTLQEITTIYTTCAFETAWKNGKPSPWCAAFSKDDLKVMAYREDLEYYWKDGYGYSINYEQACPPIQDMLEYFENKTSTIVRAHFSHSGATLKLLARFGLFKDMSPLKSNAFPEIKDTYKWRTSLMDKMATNLAFALYDCKNRPHPEIGFFFQEIPTEIPACNNNWHCSFKNFREFLSNEIGTCDLNKTCNSA